MIQNYMSGPRAGCINGESAVFQKRNRFPTRMSTKLNKQQPAFLKKDMSKLLQNSDSRICANLSIPCMYDHEGTFLVNWIINIHAKKCIHWLPWYNFWVHNLLDFFIYALFIFANMLAYSHLAPWNHSWLKI